MYVDTIYSVTPCLYVRTAISVLLVYYRTFTTLMKTWWRNATERKNEKVAVNQW